MRMFRISILLVACVAIATLLVGRSKAQTAPPNSPRPALEYGTMNENTDGFASFVTATENVSGSSYPAFAAKLGVDANRPAVLDGLGKDGWSLVCIDHDSIGTHGC